MTEHTALVSTDMPDVMTLGQLLAKSGYFQDAREAAQAVVKVLAGRELGFGPIASMTGIHIIKGRVTLSANLMAAAVKRSGRYNYRVKILNDELCTIIFYEGKEVLGESTFTIADAKKAGLDGDNWRKFTRNMVFSRSMSNGVKWFCPDVGCGPIYTPDEMGAMIDGETGEVIDVTPSPPTHRASAPAPTAETANDTPAPAPAATKAPAADAGNGDAPARKPADLLALVNSRVQVPYENLPHLRGALEGELGMAWHWPPFSDSAGWQEAYDMAIRHAEAKVIPAPAAEPIGC